MEFQACLSHPSPSSLPPLSMFRDHCILKLCLEKLGGPNLPQVFFFSTQSWGKKKKEKEKETRELVMSMGKVRWMFFKAHSK